MTLREFARIMWLQKWVILCSVIVVLGGALYYHHRSVPVYQSLATVALDPALQSSVPDAGVATIGLTPTDVQQTAVLEAAAKALGMTPGEVASAITVDSPQADTVTVIAGAGSPGRARGIAAAVAQATVDSASADLQTYLARLQAAEDDLTKQITDIQDRYNQTVHNGTGDALLQAQLSLAVQRYQGLAGQVTAAQAVASAASIVAAPALGGLVSTSLTTLLAIALLAGLVAGAGIGFLRFWLFGKVASATDVRAAVRSPVLGSVPTRPRGRGGARSATAPALADDADGTPTVEAFRALRTAMLGLLRPTGGSVVVVSGIDLGDGATYIASNLATSIARAGHATVVVGGDIRRGDLDRCFVEVDDPDDPQPETNDRESAAAKPKTGGAHGRPTTSDQRPRPRRGSNGADAGVDPRPEPVPNKPVPTAIDNLSLVRSLVSPDEGTDALAGQQVQLLIEDLREEADVVLVDSPPVLSVADPIILAGYADAVLLVVRAHSTKSHDLIRAVNRLEAAGIGTVGIVVNRARVGSGRLRAIHGPRRALTARRAKVNAPDSDH